ncbi:MAG: hypothetical protein KBD91_05160 [Paludibacteraceae bacterium]|jgi:hypothetical protein|nr:hypothetical protein [Paludibacteraceae bacterium]
MKEIIQKLSTYNIFNYLLPGIIFVAFLKLFTVHNLVFGDIIIDLFVCYFIGLVISRIGSLVIEYLLKKIRIIKFSDYKKYIQASKNDEKIELFSEINNMYRTFISLFLCLLLVIGYDSIRDIFVINKTLESVILFVVLILLFTLSYKKQTDYISKRIDAQQKGE